MTKKWLISIVYIKSNDKNKKKSYFKLTIEQI